MSVRESAGLRAALEAPLGAIIGARDLRADRRLPLCGFAYQTGAGPLRVRARIGTGPWAEAIADDFRDDIAACEPLSSEAGRSGFGLLVSAETLAGRQELRVEALLAEGPAPFCIREIELPANLPEPPAELLPAPSAQAHRRTRGSDPPRILFVSQDLALEGAQRSLLELSRSLDRSRYRARWLAPQDGPLAMELGAHGIPLDLRALRPSPGASEERAALRRAYLALPELARVRLVVANTLQAFWGLELARALGVPAVWIIRESVDPTRFLHRFWPAREAEQGIAELALADRLVFVSESTARRYASLTRPDRISVIPNGVDVARFAAPQDDAERSAARLALRAELQLAADARVLLCVGTLCQRKGQELLLRALPSLVQSDPNLHCILLGARAHAYSDALRAAAERLGIGDRVSFLARRADPRPLYRGADLALCPSYQESLPRALLEAMACALPIVASDVDGIPELVRDGREARLVAPGDPAALAAAIRELLADPSRAAALGSAARKRVESEFPLARSTERFEALFDDLLAGG